MPAPNILLFYALAGFIAAALFLGFIIVNELPHEKAFLSALCWIIAVISQYIALTEVWKYRIYRIKTQ